MRPQPTNALRLEQRVEQERTGPRERAIVLLGSALALGSDRISLPVARATEIVDCIIAAVREGA
jgi:hypothetical protein